MANFNPSVEPRTELKSFCVILSIFYMIFSIMVFASGLNAYRYGKNEQNVDYMKNIIISTSQGQDGNLVYSVINRDAFMILATFAIIGGLSSLGFSLIFFNGLITRNISRCRLWIKANLSVSLMFTMYTLYRLSHGTVHISLLAIAIFIFNLVCVAIVSTYVIELEVLEDVMDHQRRSKKKVLQQAKHSGIEKV